MAFQRTKLPEDSEISKLVIDAFKSTGYLVVNKSLIKKLGLVETIMLCNYVDKHQYFQSRDDNFTGWFFLRHQDIMDQLNLKERTVIRIKRDLILLGVIKIKRRGIPLKEWIRIDFIRLIELVYPTPAFLGGIAPAFLGGLLRRPNQKEDISSDVEKNSGKDLITPGDFDKFMKIWPPKRKGSRGKALTSWLKLCNSKNKFRPSWQRVRAAILRQKKSDQWQEEKFIPLAVTWLNNKRWLDDPKELKRYRFDSDPGEDDTKTTDMSNYYGSHD